jgi:hypothetical protein
MINSSNPISNLMGRSIPSFRHLIEIERLNWSSFKKYLSSKNDKAAFDSIFKNARLYTQYLSNANMPVPFEPVVMGALFHNYKTLLKLNKDDMETEESINQKSAVMERGKPMANMLLNETYERWNGLIYSLHKDDRERLLKMLVECCEGLNENSAKTVIDSNSKSSVSFLFILCLVMQYQKLLNHMERSKWKNAKTEVTLLDFMP